MIIWLVYMYTCTYCMQDWKKISYENKFGFFISTWFIKEPPEFLWILWFPDAREPKSKGPRDFNYMYEDLKLRKRKFHEESSEKLFEVYCFVDSFTNKMQMRSCGNTIKNEKQFAIQGKGKYAQLQLTLRWLRLIWYLKQVWNLKRKS